MIPLPFLVIGGWELAGIAVGLSYGVQLLPAVVAACRTRDLVGVSASTWIIAFVESGLWLVYGIGVGDIALTLAGTVGVGDGRSHPGPTRRDRTRAVRGGRPPSPPRRLAIGVTATPGSSRGGQTRNRH